MRKLRITAIALLVLVVQSAVGRAEQYTFQYQKILETTGRVRLSLVNHLGHVEIITHDSSGVIVDAVKKVKGATKQEASDIADRIEVKVERSSDQVDIVSNYLNVKDRSGSFWKKLIGGSNEAYGAVEYVIKVPVGSDVRVDNGYGGVTVNGVEGSVDVQSGEGGVLIDQIKGAVTIRNAAGDVNLGSIEGSVDLASNSGATVGELLFGGVMIRQPAGSIDLHWVQGDVRIKSTSARIAIKQDSGSLDLSNSTGKMVVQTNLQSQRDFMVESESGSIELLVPQSSSGSLDIRSEAGNIRSEIPVTIKAMSKRQLKGDFGSGGVRISLVSTSGDVTVAEF